MIEVNTTRICAKFGEQPNNFSCEECGLELVMGCLCVETQEEITVFCLGHNTLHTVLCKDIVFELTAKEKPAVVVKENPIRFIHKCRHYNIPIKFQSSGVTVYASSLHERQPAEPAPDFGLYLDGNWMPAMASNRLIGWADGSIPTYPIVAVKGIVEAYKKAREGAWVEVGCIGGHGRTGTVLACMAVLSGLDSHNSIKLVHEKYCKKAIETNEQSWLVNWFYTYINGGTSLPEKLWDQNDKRYTNGPVYTYAGLDWESLELSPFQGCPPPEISETVYDNEFLVPGLDIKGKTITKIVKEGDREFNTVANRYLKQEKKKKLTP